MAVFFVLLCIAFVAADENNGSLLKPCKMDNMVCIRNTTQRFLEKTANGIPGLGVKPIDPLQVASLNYDLPAFNCSHRVTNLTIVGLKNLQITDFQMDTKTQQVVLTQNISVTATGDLAVDYHVQPATKTVSGDFVSDFSFIAVTRYPYSMTKDAGGVVHYIVGNETVEFEMLGVPKYQLSQDFLDAVNADPQLAELRNSMLATQRDKLAAAILKQLVDVIVPVLVHNLRQAAAFLPASAFFTTE